MEQRAEPASLGWPGGPRRNGTPKDDGAINFRGHSGFIREPEAEFNEPSRGGAGRGGESQSIILVGIAGKQRGDAQGLGGGERVTSPRHHALALR